jgi:hypothetical protein
MTETTEGLSAAVAQQAAQSASHLAQQKVFADAVKEFQSQLASDLSEERHNARSMFSAFAGEVQSEWRAIIRNIFGAADQVASKVDNINNVSSQSLRSSS